MILEISICIILVMFIAAFWLFADPYSALDTPITEEVASNKTSTNLAAWERDVFGDLGDGETYEASKEGDENKNNPNRCYNEVRWGDDH